jgi:hypothetical protein
MAASKLALISATRGHMDQLSTVDWVENLPRLRMANPISRSNDTGHEFETCVLPERGGDSSPDATRSRPSPSVVIEAIIQYCETRGRMTFGLLLDDPAAHSDGLAYLDEFLGELEIAAVRGVQIRPTLRSVGARTYPRSTLERLGRLQGSVCFEIPEQFPQNSAEFAAHWVEAARFACEGVSGLVPLRIQVQASPKMAPAAFLRGIQRLHCTSLDVLWPRHFTPEEPPWSSRFAMELADYSISPVYGQWFSDLFRLWWILDNPRLSIESFRGLVGRFDETSARQLTGSRRAFAVTPRGKFALPRRPGGDCLSDLVEVGLDVGTTEIEKLAEVSYQRDSGAATVDALSVDRNYFAAQVRSILAQDCFQEFFYAGQDNLSFDGPQAAGDS